jgi:hypothetical protein
MGLCQNAEKRVICNLQRIKRNDDLFGICRDLQRNGAMTHCKLQRK